MNGSKNPKDKSFIEKIAVPLFWALVISISILYLLPALFVLLGAMWPKTFPGTEAIETLKQNVVDFVGVFSLFLGAFSMGYSYVTNTAAGQQQKMQEEFLLKIDDKMNSLVLNVENLKHDNEKIFDMYRNLNGRQLRGPEEANEEGSKDKSTKDQKCG